MEKKESSDLKNKVKSEAARAALLSAFVVPGAGQIYNREWGKGIFVAVLFLAASLAVLIPITIAVILYYSNINSGNLEQAVKPMQALWEAKVQLIVLAVCSILIYVYSVWEAYTKRLEMEKM